MHFPCISAFFYKITQSNPSFIFPICKFMLAFMTSLFHHWHPRKTFFNRQYDNRYFLPHFRRHNELVSILIRFLLFLTSPPFFDIMLMVDRFASVSTSQQTIIQPREANWIANSRPIPRPAPVIWWKYTRDGKIECEDRKYFNYLPAPFRPANSLLEAV